MQITFQIKSGILRRNTGEIGICGLEPVFFGRGRRPAGIVFIADAIFSQFPTVLFFHPFRISEKSESMFGMASGDQTACGCSVPQSPQIYVACMLHIFFRIRIYSNKIPRICYFPGFKYRLETDKSLLDGNSFFLRHMSSSRRRPTYSKRIKKTVNSGKSTFIRIIIKKIKKNDSSVAVTSVYFNRSLLYGYYIFIWNKLFRIAESKTNRTGFAGFCANDKVSAGHGIQMCFQFFRGKQHNRFCLFRNYNSRLGNPVFRKRQISAEYIQCSQKQEGTKPFFHFESLSISLSAAE